MTRKDSTAGLAVAFLTIGLLASPVNADDLSAKMAEFGSPMPKPIGAMGPPSVERGKEVFGQQCVLCHGVRGKGDGIKSYAWFEGQYIPDLTDADFVADRGPEFEKGVREGRRDLEPPFIAMPQFKYILSDNDIHSVVMYVRTLYRMSN